MDARAAIWEKYGSGTGSENPAAIFLRPGTPFYITPQNSVFLYIFDTIKKGNATHRCNATSTVPKQKRILATPRKAFIYKARRAFIRCNAATLKCNGLQRCRNNFNRRTDTETPVFTRDCAALEDPFCNAWDDLPKQHEGATLPEDHRAGSFFPFLPAYKKRSPP